MDNQKFALILDSLLKRSEEGNLEWIRTASEYAFLLSLKDSSISIAKYSGTIITLNFRDEKGNVVEGMNLHSSDSRFSKADKLFDLARRKATNADKTIDRILEQLNPGSIAA